MSNVLIGNMIITDVLYAPTTSSIANQAASLQWPDETWSMQ